MPKRARSCVFRPRRKEGEDAKPGPLLTVHVTINYDTLEDLFHLPLKAAAKEVGLCPTTFKKACRRFGMDEWPFQKGQSRVPPRERRVQDEGVVASIDMQLQEPAATTSQDVAPLSQESFTELNAATVSCTSTARWDTSVFGSSLSTSRTCSQEPSECELTPRHGCHPPVSIDPSVSTAASHASKPHHVSFAPHAEIFSAPAHQVSFATHAQFFPAPPLFDTSSFFVGAGPSVSEAVMDYLEGPSLAESFEFMFLPAEQDDDFGPRASSCPHDAHAPHSCPHDAHAPHPAAPPHDNFVFTCADDFPWRASSCPQQLDIAPPHAPPHAALDALPLRRAASCHPHQLATWTEGGDEEEEGAEHLLARWRGAW